MSRYIDVLWIYVNIVKFQTGNLIYTDINECETKSANCLEHEECVNEPLGNFTCQCEQGYNRSLGDLCIGMYIAINNYQVFHM